MVQYLPASVLPPADERAVLGGQYAVGVSQEAVKRFPATRAFDHHHVLVLLEPQKKRTQATKKKKKKKKSLYSAGT